MLDYLFYGANILSLVAFVLFGLSVMTWNSGEDMLAFEKTGIPAVATVLRKFSTRSIKDKDRMEYFYTYYIEYEYRTPQGEMVRQKEILRQTDWEQAPEDGEIEIRYLPDDPKKSRFKVAKSSSLFGFSGDMRKGAYGAGVLTVVGYLLWYFLSLQAATVAVVIPEHWSKQNVEIYRKMPSEDLIDRFGLGRVEVSFFVELAPGEEPDETGQVPQATRKLDKELAATIKIGDVLEARFPPDDKWSAVLSVEAAPKSD